MSKSVNVPKKKAYNSFAKLQNIFSMEGCCRDFSLYESKEDQSKIRKGPASSTVTKTMDQTYVPRSESVTVSLPPAAITKSSFKAPFKTRGKCGCSGCSRLPCEECVYCLNKSAK